MVKSSGTSSAAREINDYVLRLVKLFGKILDFEMTTDFNIMV